MNEKAEEWLFSNLGNLEFSEFAVVSKVSGESNNNLILDTDRGKRVLKVSKDISTDRLENEAQCLRFLDKNSVLNVPELVFFEPGADIGDVLIQTYVGGDDVNPEDLEGEELRKLAEAIAEHQLSIEKYNSYFDEDVKSYIGLKEFFRKDFQKWGKEPYEEYLNLVDEPDEKVKRLYRKHRKMIDSIDSDLKLEQSFIHGDLAANLRRSGDKIFVIDWELGRSGAKEIELLYLFEHSDMSEEKRKKVIKHYRRISGLSEGFEEARKLYPRSLAFNDLMWTAKRKEKARKQKDEDAERYQDMFERRLSKFSNFFNSATEQI